VGLLISLAVSAPPSIIIYALETLLCLLISQRCHSSLFFTSSFHSSKVNLKFTNLLIDWLTSPFTHFCSHVSHAVRCIDLNMVLQESSVVAFIGISPIRRFFKSNGWPWHLSSAEWFLEWSRKGGFSSLVGQAECAHGKRHVPTALRPRSCTEQWLRQQPWSLNLWFVVRGIFMYNQMQSLNFMICHCMH
jgi:hypothetical protein